MRKRFVDSARMIKRIQPAPQGRAHRIRKRSNHVTIIVDKQLKRIITIGQKVNIANRLGIIRGWDSSWFGTKKDLSRNYYKILKFVNILHV